MRAEGHGFTAVTARAGVPVPKFTSSNRTIFDDLARAQERRKSTGPDWAALDAARETAREVGVARVPQQRGTSPAPVSRVAHARIEASPSAAAVSRMVDLYEGGASLRDVAKATGFSRSTIARWLRSRGVVIHPPATSRRNYVRPTPEDKVCENPACSNVVPYDPSMRIDQFKAKKTCSRACSYALSGSKRKK